MYNSYEVISKGVLLDLNSENNPQMVMPMNHRGYKR